MAYLIVEAFFSRCSDCRGNADPTEDRHLHGGRRGGYEFGSDTASTNGCGAVFTHRVDPNGRPIVLDGPR